MQLIMEIILLCALVAVVESFTYFTTDNDNEDVDAILKDPPLVKHYMDCFVGRSDCDKFSYSYKKNMAEAIPTTCFRCTDGQKHMWNKFLPGLKKLYPTEYEAFQRTYDPLNISLSNFMDAVKDY